jgi:hypothetical protein
MSNEHRLARGFGIATALCLVACSSSLGGPAGTGGTTGIGGTSGAAGVTGTTGDAGTPGTSGSGGTAGSAGTAGGGTGGIGGTTGTAGVTGFAGTSGAGGTGVGPGTGVGGTGETCLPSVPTNCGSALCGNGVRDTCSVHAGFGFCPLVQVTEGCDGQDFGTDTCFAHGFGSGALTCDSCTVNQNSCSDCVTGAPVAGCGTAPVDIQGSLATVDMAATDTEIGVAWIAGGISFARFSADLTLLGQTKVVDPILDSGPSLRGYIGIGTLPAGWVILAYAEPELFIHTMDATGKDLGRTRVDGLPVNSFAYVTLASRPSGGPLVVWLAGTNLRAAIVAADGRSASTPVDILPVTSTPQSLSAAWVGDAFYVAITTGAAQMRLVRVGADGVPGTGVTVLPGTKARDVRLVSNAGDLRVLYLDEASANSGDLKTIWQKIAATGAASSDPVVIPGPKKYGAVGGVAFDGDTVALLRYDNSLDMVRIGPTGAIVTAPVTVGKRPNYLVALIRGQFFARRGAEAVAGWNTDSDIRLARIAP